METNVIFGIVGAVAAMFTSAGFVPQVVKGFKTKKLNDVATSTLILSAAGTFLWAVYGFSKHDLIIIAANIFTCSTVLLLLIMQTAYKK